MTTTISKHDLQLQQQLQQQQQQHQQQQQLLLLHQPEHAQQPTLHVQYTDQTQQQQANLQKQQHSSHLFKSTTNKSLLIKNTVSSLVDNTTNIYDLDAATATLATVTATAATPSASITTTTTTTTTRLDSATAIIQIDSLNNNTTSLSVTTNAITTATTPTNNNGCVLIPTSEASETEPKTQKRRSLLNFKSFDFHIKSLYSGLRNGNKHSQSQSSSLGGCVGGGSKSGASAADGDGATDNANGSGLLDAVTPIGNRGGTAINNRMPPYLKIESVDAEEAENLLLDYPQSPYSSRRNSSHEDDHRSSSQLLHINRYDMCSRSQASSPSPYYLSPYAIDSGNIRRSSTSDIMSCKRSGTSSASDSRRPSTSDLLRKARERRGSEARMGRSVSHSGLPRGGGPRLGAGGGGGGGRRTSMAF
ncbi:putative mediator of RNA polymerase II transcription subunit 26 [Zeugodacus cucurbitae]|nr:putative mediator of RNA polymerase II transcription subunit 26 [Zeugodacus cucurbitae]